MDNKKNKFSQFNLLFVCFIFLVSLTSNAQAGSIQSEAVYAKMESNLAVKLKKIRKVKGHTMRSLAGILGTPHSFIGKYENGERTLRFTEVVKICDALECDVTGLIQSIQE
jgi:DNA-binding Xre family transcriptional regulator